MKKSELIFNVISVPVDFLMILLSATLAYFLRYRVETLPVIFDLSYQNYVKLVLVAIPFLILLFALSGLYTQKSTRSFWREMGKIAVAVSAGLMIVVVLFFFNRNLFPSRLIVLMGWLLAVLLTNLGRGILLFLQRWLLARGVGKHRLFVVEGRGGNRIVKEIMADSRLGYEVIEIATYSAELLKSVETIHRQERIDELLQADPGLSFGSDPEIGRVVRGFGN
jgi:FlaA1/EpsC-like NDP-sugar epimerase